MLPDVKGVSLCSFNLHFPNISKTKTQHFFMFNSKCIYPSVDYLLLYCPFANLVVGLPLLCRSYLHISEAVLNLLHVILNLCLF